MTDQLKRVWHQKAEIDNPIYCNFTEFSMSVSKYEQGHHEQQ